MMRAMAQIWRPAVFEEVLRPEDYPTVTDWSGPGWVSEIRTPYGTAGWLVRKDEELEFLSLHDTPDPEPAHILAELRWMRAQDYRNTLAFDYVLIDREHSEPELVDLGEFRKVWDSERKP